MDLRVSVAVDAAATAAIGQWHDLGVLANSCFVGAALGVAGGYAATEGLHQVKQSGIVQDFLGGRH